MLAAILEADRTAANAEQSETEEGSGKNLSASDSDLIGEELGDATLSDEEFPETLEGGFEPKTAHPNPEQIAESSIASPQIESDI